MIQFFLDTNIILEYFCARQQCKLVERIFESANNRQFDYHLSLGSFYTITYYVEDELKRQGNHRPELTEKLRQALEALLQLFRISAVDEKRLLDGVRDQNFSDLEDSYQYQVAKAHGCKAIVTINTRDFRKVMDGGIEILTPAEFVEKYL